MSSNVPPPEIGFNFSRASALQRPCRRLRERKYGTYRDEILNQHLGRFVSGINLTAQRSADALVQFHANRSDFDHMNERAQGARTCSDLVAFVEIVQLAGPTGDILR